ncbi:type II toxin-antitoxin system VapC family toxin [Desulforamulus putei]|uniref:Predicted nucleic acid-binding protein, contains PIN domain n=1 Tax=Desulforamulus putei DSM 12395 TaxID=1121429 RepID=A0A1M4YH11_9FIRM|nr:type II toxin-antitoxin system VapC family toxin [Desulforamulus putei]SHF04968.1 Predicted nucleic acid-binding protein, contains PIN domain [Desulforamulus putei DSM 12395]
MSSFICLDSSVLIKLLVLEEDSDKADALMEKILEKRQSVVLPGFAWAEVGSVLRKKVNKKMITPDQAEIAWEAFNNLGILNYLNDSVVIRAAWHIAVKEKLPTLYDATYLAVAEIISRQSNEVCQFWTADETLIRSIKDKNYVYSLKTFGGI